MMKQIQNSGIVDNDETRGTRKRILIASLDLFSVQGFPGTSMRQIARAVGVRESALYTHFKSKQDILDSLFGLYGPGTTAALFNSIERDELLRAPCATLKRFLARAIDIWCTPEERKFMRLGLMESIRAEDALCNQTQTAVECMKGHVRDLFERLVSEKMLVDLDPDFLLVEFMGPLFVMRHELTMFIYSDEARLRLKTFAEKHVDFFFKNTLRSKETP